MSAVADAAVLVTPSAKPTCEILCSDSESGCDPGDHVAFNPDHPGVTWLNGMRRLGSHPYQCYGGTCATEHDEGLCQGIVMEGELLLTAEHTEDLRQAVADGDATEVEALLGAHSSQLSFNVERSAIQVLACNGRVREHMPLPDAMVRHLVDAVR
jgi:hypothetical protein